MLDWHQDYTRPLSVKNWKMEFLFRYLSNENIFRISTIQKYNSYPVKNLEKIILNTLTRWSLLRIGRYTQPFFVVSRSLL